jgi:hypothetical protein
MNTDLKTGSPGAAVAAATPTGVSWRSVGWITAAACALYVGFRLLPTGTNLHHMDFQVSGANALEMCDPATPQFIPVVAMRSPVRMELRPEGGAVPAAGRETRWVLGLATSGGKTIGPVDLLTVHTRKLHLLVVDPSLADYQHLHPEPGERPGEWVFAHTPRFAGEYRVFADFTPAATGRGLYSFADYTAAAGGAGPERAAGWRAPGPAEEVERGDYRLSLGLEQGDTVQAGRPGTLVFAIRRADGAPVPLEPVMGAYVHTTAFDEGRSGFAHLHPRLEPGEAEPPKDGSAPLPPLRDPLRPRFAFDVMIPREGRYLVWAQFRIAGEEWFQPFALEVVK